MAQTRKESIDLFTSVTPNDRRGNSSLFMNNMEQHAIEESEKLSLSPCDFLCQYHDMSKKVADLLTAKYGAELTKIPRAKISMESYNDVVSLLMQEQIFPQETSFNDS